VLVEENTEIEKKKKLALRLTVDRRREVGEGEEVVELPQLRRRVHGLLAAAASGHGAGRPGLGGRIGGGRRLLLGLPDPERGGARDDVEQPTDVRDGELLCVLLCGIATGVSAIICVLVLGLNAICDGALFVYLRRC
jgi:hypothetical protein